MNPTADPILASLRAAIVARPDDLAVRLVCADYLEEISEDVSLMEFIRAGIKFNAHPCSTYIETGDYDTRDGVSDEWRQGFDLFDAVMKLLWKRSTTRNLANWQEWCWAEARDEEGTPCPVSGEGGMTVTPHGSPRLHGEAASCTIPTDAGQVRQFFRNGFVEFVKCPESAWLASGAEIVRQHPITKVVLTDKEPAQDGSATPWDWWYSEGVSAESARIAWIAGEKDLIDKLIPSSFKTREAALAALSDVAITWARRLAGLPEWTREKMS